MEAVQHYKKDFRVGNSNEIFDMVHDFSSDGFPASDVSTRKRAIWLRYARVDIHYTAKPAPAWLAVVPDVGPVHVHSDPPVGCTVEPVVEVKHLVTLWR